MSEIQGGRYLIAAVTRDNLNGGDSMFITRSNPLRPLTVSPPGPPESQDWKPTRHGPEKDIYILTPFFGPDLGFSWNGDCPEPGEAVLFNKPREFRVNHAEGMAHDIFWIQPVGGLVGLDCYVGYDHDSKEVQIVAFPFGFPIERRPIWKFLAIFK